MVSTVATPSSVSTPSSVPTCSLEGNRVVSLVLLGQFNYYRVLSTVPFTYV